MLELHLARPADLEHAIGLVSTFLDHHRPRDRPLISLPVLVDRPAHAAWVRTWLAQHHPTGTSIGLAVVPAWAALDGLLAAAAPITDPADGATPATDHRGLRWWEGPGRDDSWSAAALTHRILDIWRDHAQADELTVVRDYIHPSASPRADVRRTLLAERAARRLHQAMSHDATSVLEWCDPGAGNDSERWFRFTLSNLDLLHGPAGSRVKPDLDCLRPLVDRPLAIFGLADADPATVALIQALAELQPVCWVRPSTTFDSPSPLPPSAARAQAVEVERIESLPASTPLSSHTSAFAPTLERWRAWLTGASSTSSTSDLGEPPLFPAWTPRREVELVRDALLHRFNEGDLEPRQVRLLTPDLATYGPLLFDVFSESGDGAAPKPLFADAEPADQAGEGAATQESAQPPAGQVPKIPLQLIGLGLTATNPVAAALLKTLDLLTDRLTLSGWYELLCSPQVKRRFGLGRIHNDRLRELLVTSGARWGFDGAERSEVYGVEAPVHSVEFGLQRLALSAFVHQELDPSRGQVPTRWGPGEALLFPGEVGESEGYQAGARLQIAFETLRSWRERLRVGPSPKTWPALLGELLDDLVQTGSSTRFLRQQVNDVLGEVLGEDTSLSAETVAALLRERFDQGLKGDAKGLPGVQVASLDESNALPADLVIVMGMNSGAFPRRDDRPSWMPSGTRPPRTARDQQAFSAAVLAAKREVWLTWTAREPRRGEPVPPSSLVEDLIDALNLSKEQREEAVWPRGRHRWSASAGETWGTSMIAAAEASTQRADSETEPRWGVQVVPTEDYAATPPPRTMSLSQLRAALLNPSKTLLTKGLGVWLDNDERDLRDHDPRDLAPGLESWQVKDTLIRLLLHDPDADDSTAFEVLVGNGLLPANEVGRMQMAKTRRAVTKLLKRRKDWVTDGSSETQETVALQLKIGHQEVNLTGTLPEIITRNEASQSGPIRILTTTSASNHKNPNHLLSRYLELLLANATGAPAPAATTFFLSSNSDTQNGICLRRTATGLWHGHDEPIPSTSIYDDGEIAWLQGDSPEHLARETLRQLVEIALSAEQRAVPLFPASSYKIAQTLLNLRRSGLESETVPWSEVFSTLDLSWYGDKWNKGDSTELYVARLYPDLDLLDTVAHNAAKGSESWQPNAECDLRCPLSAALYVWWPVACGLTTMTDLKNADFFPGAPR